MKKNFKRAGVAVLSMAMLLSMGAVGAMTTSAATTITVSDPQNTGAVYKYIKIADATLVNGRYEYSGLNAKFADVLQINAASKNIELKAALGSIAAGTSIGNIASHSADAKALADALVAKATNAADYTDLPTSLKPGYYLLKDSNNTAGGIPVLLSITDESSKTIEAKATVIPFNKTITGVKDQNSTTLTDISSDGHSAVVESKSTVTYQLASEFPMYDPVNVVAKNRYKAYADETAKAAGNNLEADWDGVHYTEDVNSSLIIGDATTHYIATYASNITDFTITDVPEDTLTIKTDTIKVYLGSVADSSLVAAANYTLNARFANTNKVVNSDKKYFTESTDDVAGTGFQITFNDEYVILNRGAKVYVTFDAEVAEAPDVDNDKNANQATVEYNNDYFTGGSKKNADGSPVTEPDKPNTQKDSEADVYATLLNVNKVDGANAPLTGAVFNLYKTGDTTKKLVGKCTLTDGYKFEFKGLGVGTYVLEETTVPPGYAKAKDIEFTVATSDTSQYLGNFTYSNNVDSSTTNTLTVVNHKGETLPGTGGIGTVLFTVGGAAIVLLAGFMFVIYMRKRQDEK